MNGPRASRPASEARGPFEHFFRMLAQQRLAIDGLRRLVFEADDGREVLAAFSVGQDGAALRKVRISDGFGQRRHRAPADVERVEPRHPVRQRLGPERGFEEFHHRLLMRTRPFAERRHLRPAERAQKVLDELHLLACDHELAAVGRIVNAIEG